MSRISGPTGPSPSSALPAVAPSRVLEASPALLAQSVKPVSISGEVIGRLHQGPQAGALEIQTPQGKIVVQTPLPLPPGAAVIIELKQQPGQPNILQALIQALPKPGAPVANAPLPAATPAPAIPLEPGFTGMLNFIETGGAAAHVYTAGQNPQALALEAATNALLAVLARPALPIKEEAAKNDPAKTPPPGAKAANTPPANPPVPASPAAALFLPEAESQPQKNPALMSKSSIPTYAPAENKTYSALPPPVQAKVLMILTPDGAPQGNAKLPGPGKMVPATVIGTTSQGQTLLQLPQGVAHFSKSFNVPPGTQVWLEVSTPAPMPLSTAPITWQQSAALPALARAWPALSDALAIFQQKNPPIAAQLAQHLNGQNPAHLANTVFAFLQGLQKSEMNLWLTPEIFRLLQETIGEEGAKKLTADWQEQARYAATKSGEWQAAFIPMFDGAQFHPIRFFWHRKAHEEQEGKDHQRFIVEVDFTRLGPFQLDGYVAKQRFDLMVRTAQALAPNMREDITKIFQDYSEAAGLKGQLLFQVESPFAVQPLN
ncbi:MAG: hypothetical protein AB7U41_05645, partial [Dongiaceae bacterium]